MHISNSHKTKGYCIYICPASPVIVNYFPYHLFLQFIPNIYTSLKKAVLFCRSCKFKFLLAIFLVPSIFFSSKSFLFPPFCSSIYAVIKSTLPLFSLSVLNCISLNLIDIICCPNLYVHAGLISLFPISNTWHFFCIKNHFPCLDTLIHLVYIALHLFTVIVVSSLVIAHYLQTDYVTTYASNVLYTY